MASISEAHRGLGPASYRRSLRLALCGVVVPLLVAGSWAPSKAGPVDGPPSATASPPRYRAYEFYARVTAYHNGPGDHVNGGPLNFMGRPLVTGRSAAGPSLLAGSLVEVPDFNPRLDSGGVSSALRRFLQRRGYDGFFVLDDIGSAITFINGGRAAQRKGAPDLQKLSRHSLATGEPVLDLDIMVPDSGLAEGYENPRCLVRLYQAELGETSWIPSRSPVWGGRKPYFDTVRRHRAFMQLLRGEPLVAATTP